MDRPAFREALGVWVKIGLLSFGGPTGQIALMHQEIVERRGWLGESSFLRALGFCMLLPGPEAQQLAIYTGWLLHGIRGGVAAGVLFVLPGALLMVAISILYVSFGRMPWVEALFAGIQPAVVAIVAAAFLRLGGRVLRTNFLWAVAGGAFLLVAYAGVSFPVVVLGAGVAAWALGSRFPGLLGRRLVGGEPRSDRARLRSTLLTAGAWTALWLAPLALCVTCLGPRHTLSEAGLFFAKAALVTFGGAYAVLPYVAQQAVEIHHWLSPAQMMDGLALAETTPGPLILVLQFVGFLAGWNVPEGGDLWLSALLAAALTSWTTFLPGFLFVFAGAPHVESLRDQGGMSDALKGVSAAVAGVMLTLAVWFAWHTFSLTPGQIDWPSVFLGMVCFGLLRSGRIGIPPVIGIAALVGLVRFAMF